MRNRREYRRHAAVLILAVAGLITCMGSSSASSGLTSARAAAPSWDYTGSLNTNRYGHTATLLPTGKVLVVGGGGWPCSGGYCYSTVNGSAELYDPASGTWGSAGSPGRRTDHKAILLLNGQVLVAGGVNYGFDIGRFEHLTSAELYDPATGVWRPTGGFNRIIGSSSAALLPNGKVLAVGSSNLNSSPVVHAELYDPATGVWSLTSAPSASSLCPLTVLPDGKVLYFVGDAAEMYDPAAERWGGAGKLNVIRSPGSATLLRNGKVLVIGYAQGGSALAAELYDPATGSSSGTAIPGHFGAVTLLHDGRVLIAGGYDFSSSRADSSAELYDPSTGTWWPTSRLNVARSGHTATLLPDGRVVVAGGFDGDGDIGTLYHDSAELYTPASVPNPADDPQFFVRQHYRDFLGREPDDAGLAFWTNEITSCGADAQCVGVKRINVSAAFFLSIEFQETGFYAIRVQRAAFGRRSDDPATRLSFDEASSAQRQIGQGVVVGQSGYEQALDGNKNVYASQVANGPAFNARFLQTGAAQYVDALYASAGVTPTAAERQAAVDAFNSAGAVEIARAATLRKVADSASVRDAEFNTAFVLLQYHGYLRRDPDEGYNFWLGKLNSFNGDYVQAEMVKAFLDSVEYRRRFGQN